MIYSLIRFKIEKNNEDDSEKIELPLYFTTSIIVLILLVFLGLYSNNVLTQNEVITFYMAQFYQAKFTR